MGHNNCGSDAGTMGQWGPPLPCFLKKRKNAVKIGTENLQKGGKRGW